jgi:REP element-mobilizing transposase RayT
MPKYDPERHRRRSVRLDGYDYSQDGAYFVTICAHERECLFGDILGQGMMHLSKYGLIVQEEWLRTADLRREVELDAFVVMPNHFHGIVVFANVGAQGLAPLQTPPPTLYRPAKSLGSLVGGFKAAVTKRINQLRDTPQAPVWQRSYYDRIIRDVKSLNLARHYIEHNPVRWAEDQENPQNQR